MRTCIGCRERFTPEELIRIVRVDEATIHVGRTLDGRGAWLCPAPKDCLERAAREGGFARAFRARVTAPAVEALRLGWSDRGPETRSDFVLGTPPARD